MITITISRAQAVAGLVVAAVLVAVAVLAGCGKTTEPFRDAGVSSVNNSKAVEVTMPDGFSNMSVKCVAPGVLGASAYHGDGNRAAVALVADPLCK